MSNIVQDRPKSTMSDVQTTTVLNGDSPHSTTLRHLLTLPAVQDGVRAFQANPLGKMSMQLSNSAYQMVGAPIMSLLYKPLSYVSPYVQRVDEFGDQTLSKVEEKYPVVKKPSPELLKGAKEAAYAPVQHVSSVYNRAYQQTPGGHAIATGKAAAKTVVFVWFEGAIFTLRKAIKVTDSFSIDESLKTALDKLEAALYGQQNATIANDTNHTAEPNGQDEHGAKTSSA